MMLPSGKYRACVVDYGVYQASTGQQFLTVFVDFRLLGRYNPSGQLEDCPPEERSLYRAITEKTIRWVLADLKAIGFDRDSFTFFDPETPGAVNLYGREIEVVCDHEDYQGSPRERWAVRRDRAREKVGSAELARLDALYAEDIARVLGNGETAVTASSKNNETERSDAP